MPTDPDLLVRRKRIGRALARVLCGALALLPAFGSAGVKYAAADSFALEYDQKIAVSNARVYAGLAQVGQWWDGEHSWSGDASHLTLVPEAGGCFCERWPGGSVEHGRVVMAMTDRIVRLEAPLGPLQGRALQAMLTFEIKLADGGTALHTTFIVNGASDSQLDALSGAVDEMLGEQLERFKRYLETGKP